MSASFQEIVNPAFVDDTAVTLLAASPAALKGLSDTEAAQLQQALGISSINDFARNQHVAQAHAVLAAAGTPGFDLGPPPYWEQRFSNAPLAHYRDHPSQRFRTAFGPVFYRGRLDRTARVLMIGQDPSTDEILAQRILVGEAGQRVQGLLRKIGIVRSYVMINTFLYGIIGQVDAEMRAISIEPPIMEYRNALLDDLAATNPLEAVIMIGAAARLAVEHWTGGQHLTKHELTHPTARQEVLINWNSHLPQLHATITPDQGATVDLTPYGDQFTPQDSAPIPRFDLPFGIPPWHGSDGTRSTRQGTTNQILWQAP